MWSRKAILKRIISKNYTNIKNIYEMIVEGNSRIYDAVCFIGSSFIGGGIMGTSVFTDCKIENNRTLKATIEMKDTLVENVIDRKLTIQDVVYDQRISLLSKGEYIQTSISAHITSYGMPIRDLIKNYVNIYINGVEQKQLYNSFDVEWKQVSNAVFDTKARGMIVFPFVSKGDKIEIKMSGKHFNGVSLNGGVIYISLSQLVSEGKDLPNDVQVNILGNITEI